MATKDDIADAKTELETENPEEPSRKTNSDEDTGKDSDIDMIFEEIAGKNTDSNEKSKDSVLDEDTKPNSGIRLGTSRKTMRGRFFRRGTGRGFRHRPARTCLPKIPDGILYVKNGTYIGYHCTYCNCALKTLLSVKQHVVGNRHQETLKSKKINEGSTAEKNDTEKPSADPANKANPKTNLKSSLDEYLATITEPIIGLSHIIEIANPGKPSSFECRLCRYSSLYEEIKEHINGTRHRLMYLKTVDPKRIAEMMSKNLTKSERNQKILDHAKELEEKHGRGTIEVKSENPEEASRSIRRAREWTRGRGRGSIRGGRLASVRRGMRGIRGGRRPLIRGGRRGSLNRGRIPRRSLLRMGSERRKQSISQRFRGRISHNSARPPVDPYVASYYSDYADWVMRTGNNQYEADPYYNRDPYYPDPYPAPREYYMEGPYERMDRPHPQEVYPRYDYRPPYEDELPSRDYGPSSFQNRDHRSTSPGQNRSSQHKPESADAEENPLKNLPSFNVTSEKDAGVVMDVITSLAESLLGYKMRGSPQEILQKLDEEKKKSASSHPDKSESRAAEKFSKASDAMDQSVHNWNETGEIRTRHSGTYDPSTRGWAGRRSQDHLQHKQDVHDRTPPPSRRHMDAIRDRSPPTRPIDIVRDRSPPPPRRSVDMRGRSPPMPRRPMDMRTRSPPPRRSVDAMRDRTPPPQQKRPIDVMRDRSPPRRPMDVMQDRSSPAPPRRPMDIMRDRSPPRRPMDVMRDRSPPRRPMDVMRDRSPPAPPRRPMDVMRNRSPPAPPRRPMDVMRNRSPPPLRGSPPAPPRRPMDVMRNRSPPPLRGSVGFMRDRSPSHPSSHPSFVDDMFDDYQKSQNATRGSYSTPTGSAPPGYQSSFSSPSIYGTPASYTSPSFNTSSFSRSSESRRFSNTGNFGGDNQERNVLDWKYRSLR